MESLKAKSNFLVTRTPLDFSRYLMEKIDWSWRLVGILGARGAGKTTLLLQYLKRNIGIGNEAMYASLDDIYFSGHTLYNLAQEFSNKGGKYLFIDEVHKYPSWSAELKNIYDSIPDLNVVFTGSSIIDLLKQDTDLSRRAITYELNGLSFREYLALNKTATIQAIDLRTILHHHSEISLELSSQFKPLLHFNNYLKHGYYPFFIESEELYQRRLEQVLQLTMENDLAFIDGYDPRNAFKIKQLLYIIAENVPFKPNLVRISEKIGIHRNTLINYLFYLEKAKIINLLYPSGISVSILQKPEKIFLNNPNLAWLLSEQTPNKGSLRETFFFNQISAAHIVKAPKAGDFEVDNQWIFEIGGEKKTAKQIHQIPNGYIVSDDIETGAYQKIPLWLFGLLY